jgi:hypothetical protein
LTPTLDESIAPSQRSLFGDLLSAADEDWPAFRRRLRGDRTPARADDLEATKGPAERDEGQSWERLLQCVDRLAADTDLPENLGPYKYWCQRVARYSFQTGRLAMLAGSDSDTAVVASGGPQLTTPSGAISQFERAFAIREATALDLTTPRWPCGRRTWMRCCKPSKR